MTAKRTQRPNDDEEEVTSKRRHQMHNCLEQSKTGNGQGSFCWLCIQDKILSSSVTRTALNGCFWKSMPMHAEGIDGHKGAQLCGAMPKEQPACKINTTGKACSIATNQKGADCFRAVPVCRSAPGAPTINPFLQNQANPSHHELGINKADIQRFLKTRYFQQTAQPARQPELEEGSDESFVSEPRQSASISSRHLHLQYPYAPTRHASPPFPQPGYIPKPLPSWQVLVYNPRVGCKVGYYPASHARVTWHRAHHAPIRQQCMIQLNHLLSRKASMDANLAIRLPEFVRRLEQGLYDTSYSLSEYSDFRTLPLRVLNLIRALQHRHAVRTGAVPLANRNADITCAC